MMLPSRVFFDHFFDDFDSSKELHKLMKCDIYTKDDHYVFEMDIPGAKKEDIAMELENGYLKVSIENKSDNYDQDREYIHRERHSYTKCQRQFYVGDVSEDLIKAKFKDGILTILVPKVEDKNIQKKTIMIED